MAKYRMDFVSNSSSSSFLLAFSDERHVGHAVANDKALSRGEYDSYDYARILLDGCVPEGEVLDKERVISRYKAWVYGEAAHEVNSRLFHRGIRASEWRNTHRDEYEAMVEKKVKGKVEKFKKYLEGKTYFIDIEVSDQNGSIYSDLEHEIVPNMKCCVAMRSWH